MRLHVHNLFDQRIAGLFDQRYSFLILRIQLRLVRSNARTNVGRHVQQLQPNPGSASGLRS